ncbi:MAG TPA: Gfo/Idh/MocA family oxidoreductase [Bacteroidales bacterium]|nr:Gfo/Idh/MocA family oxidoreductase [Bacteroidales bacterium]
MLKMGVLGAGHLGKIHIQCIREIGQYELLGFYDPDESIAQQVAEEFSIPSFSSLDDLIRLSDVVDIVTPTVSHFDCASRALKQSRHVFIEKPVVATPREAMELIKIAQEANVKVQVGHVERFNPAFLAAQPYIKNPMFIETHRLAPFNPRGTDVPVVLDLMIHDIDIVLSVVRSNVHKISASGVPILSDTPDIANARLEFDNGCVANLTASRVSMKKMRKSRFFQRDAYIAVDFLEKNLEIIRMRDLDPGNTNPFAMIIDLGPDKAPRELLIEKPPVEPANAIRHELELFALSVMNDTNPPVTIIDGYNALEIAYRIIEKINHSPLGL